MFCIGSYRTHTQTGFYLAKEQPWIQRFALCKCCSLSLIEMNWAFLCGLFIAIYMYMCFGFFTFLHVLVSELCSKCCIMGV